jgi:CyaY protein
MDERDFLSLADAELARLEQRLEACGVDMDIETKPGGIIELVFADDSKIIINRHAAAREIWVAAKSGGFHFKPDGQLWKSARDGLELYALLERCIGEQSGTSIDLCR